MKNNISIASKQPGYQFGFVIEMPVMMVQHTAITPVFVFSDTLHH